MQVADTARRTARPFGPRSPGRGLYRVVVLLFCVVLVVVLAAACGGAVWSAGVTTTWTSRAAAVIVPPERSAVPDDNPMLRLNPGLGELAPVVAASLDSLPAVTALRRQGADASFSIDVAAAPSIRFDVTASSPVSATRTATALLTVARTQLAALQSRADADGARRATLFTVLPPTVPVREVAHRRSVAGGVAAAVLVIGLLFVLVLGLVTRRGGGHGTGSPRPMTRRMRRLEQRSARDPEAVVVPRTR